MSDPQAASMLELDIDEEWDIPHSQVHRVVPDLSTPDDEVTEVRTVQFTIWNLEMEFVPWGELQRLGTRYTALKESC